ncbi:CubicO group peptidase (beta-lactamase class C family) [Duganella sp. 1224]|uniref:serine hydrolase domain-containing protein n=1 Tax=Duganella sp. 1224 TaxID=2587052 RepID=UPI0015C82CB5|nr:serine hydrolase [Duganella sp. 1224]NYE59803.1 CubicO group peptidase (beta-lactamase class C family) [Duganella sp. 1224]
MKKLLCLLLLTALPALAQPLEEVLARWDRDQHPDLRSVLVMRDGVIVAERYYNGETADTLHDIRSAGKSITALLVGAAADRGKLSPDGRIDSYWPAAKGTALQGVTLDQVLTMRSGLAAFDEDPASPGNEDKLDEAADPIAFALAVPADATPGTRYRYNSLTSYVAGITIEQATGMDLEAFAREALFAPLGITRWQWLRDAAHHPKGQGNLFLRTRDLARIGQMVLDQGMYQGRRVISAAWLRAALAPRVAIGEVDRYADHYGYFWYQKTYGNTVVHFASGNGGNKIYVIPASRSVVVVTSSAYGKGYGQRRSAAILQAILDTPP